MRPYLCIAALGCASATGLTAARCTTVLNMNALAKYDSYVVTAEAPMKVRFESGELAWLPEGERRRAAAELASGKLVKRNMAPPEVNGRLTLEDGTVLDWVGAILVPGARVSDVETVLQDFARYDVAYRPLIYHWLIQSKAQSGAPSYDVIFGLQHSFRFASVFPQQFAFQVRGRMDFARSSTRADLFYARIRSEEIRESNSGEPGRNDLLEQYHDHGIMWALNAYWRARQSGSGVYLEFESITLARSVEKFSCTLGIVPVPKAVVSAAMNALPVQSVELMLTATRSEWQRRSSSRAGRAGDQ